jgi:dTDP-glucose pyrophosphorylase
MKAVILAGGLGTRISEERSGPSSVRLTFEVTIQLTRKGGDLLLYLERRE